MLKEGDKAPHFKVRDADGNQVKLSAFRGQKVVLYFYPKDDTYASGCYPAANFMRLLRGRFARHQDM